MGSGSFTPQPDRRHGAPARSFNFDATSGISLFSSETPELPPSQFQFLQSLSQFPQWAKPAF
jgi:hypothetical protein